MKVEEGLQIYKHKLDMFEACKKYKYKNVKSTNVVRANAEWPDHMPPKHSVRYLSVKINFSDFHF